MARSLIRAVSHWRELFARTVREKRVFTLTRVIR